MRIRTFIDATLGALVLCLIWPLSPPSAIAADGTWNEVSPSGTLPPARRDAGVAYDSQGDKLVVIGGSSGETATWVLDLSGTPAWTTVGLGTRPAVSGNDRAIYDPVGNRVILVTRSMQVWALSLASPTNWVLLATGAAPSARNFYAVAYDSARNRLLIFGGGPESGLFNDVWALPLSGPSQIWSQVTFQGTPPSPRWGPVAAYDSVHDRLIITSGSLDTGYGVSNDVWALSLGGTPTWTQLAPSGPAPPARMLSSAIYDPALDQLLLFGGFSGSTALEDVWSLSLGTSVAWKQWTTEGAPPPGRWSHGAAWRSTPSQMVIFGGFGGGTGNDTWALDYDSTGPPSVSGFDPTGGRVGDPVTISGTRLAEATDVQFNGISAPILASAFGSISTQVPLDATTGPIRVVTPEGEATSTQDFFVGETPVISSATPDSGKIGNTTTLQGAHFTGAIHVAIGGAGATQFVVVSDEVIEATVDSLATTGPISVTTPAATGTSSFSFKVLPIDTSARIASVKDIPADQGGRVVLSWLGSDLDVAPRRQITGYRVWRRAPLGTEPGSTRLSLRRAVAANGDVVFWEPLAVIPSAYREGYAYVAPTTQDSVAAGNPYTAFLIQTLTEDPFVFYDSPVDSGYSVDNLAPAQPQPFVGVYGPLGVALHWLPNLEADLAGYQIHRGSSADFQPSAGSLVSAQPDTGFHDTGGTFLSYYKLSAIDIHGNASPFALVSPDLATPALVSLQSAEVEPGRVRLIWYVSTGQKATVYRRLETTDWTALGEIAPDGESRVAYEDVGLAAGRYGYRLGLQAGTTETFAGEVWVEVPELDLSVSVAPNPTTGSTLAVQLALPDARAASLELLDVAGRLIESRGLESLGPGRHTVTLRPRSPLAPGMYLVRLKHEGDARLARMVVIR